MGLTGCYQSQSSSPKSHVAAIAGGVVGGLLACLLVVAATVMYNRHRRDLRKRMTQQFVMKKGLVLGKPTDNKDVVSDEHFNPAFLIFIMIYSQKMN